jgi:hypothetical protein
MFVVSCSPGHRPRPKIVRQIHNGTPLRRNFLRLSVFLLNTYHDPGNPTHSRPALSVFFCFRLKLFSYEVSLAQPSPTPCHLDQPGSRPLRWRTWFLHFRRHLQALPQSKRHRLLLQLCSVENVRRLHEDVRVAQICVSLVGSKLRQTAGPGSRHNARRRPALSSSPARRTRQQLTRLTCRHWPLRRPSPILDATSVQPTPPRPQSSAPVI